MNIIKTEGKSNGIFLEIKSLFDIQNSNPSIYIFNFQYHILIRNENPFTITLLRRKWEIYDSNSEQRMVEGEGVVGYLPTIETNKSFSYSSGCNLKTEMGSMKGFYYMVNTETNETINVQIPEFKLIADYKLN